MYIQSNCLSNLESIWKGVLSGKPQSPAELLWDKKLKALVGRRLDESGEILASYMIPSVIRTADFNTRIFLKMLPIAALKAIKGIYQDGGPIDPLTDAELRMNNSTVMDAVNRLKHKRDTKRHHPHNKSDPNTHGMERRRNRKIDW